VGGRPVVVTWGEEGVRLRDLGTGAPLGDPLPEAAGRVACVSSQGRVLAITGAAGADTSLLVWDLASHQLLHNPLEGHEQGIVALDCTVVDDRPVAVTADWSGRTLRWDLLTGEYHELFTGYGIYSLACTRAEGRPVVVTGSGNGVLRVWDMATGSPCSPQIKVHSGELHTFSCAQVDGRSVAVIPYHGGAVSGREPVAAEVGIWDLVGHRPYTAALSGHTGWVLATAITTVNGQPTIVTAGSDATVRLWDFQGSCLETFAMPSTVSDIAVAPSGELALLTDPGDLVVLSPPRERV
jgi:WD40 repeat protein